jgi:biopolymer transport protein ExbD/biopolymer transport protein TolR
MSAASWMRPRPRLRFVRPAAAPLAAINVTPLVDVVLVLLIIFMVVTPLLEKKLDVSVPASRQVETERELPAEQLLVNVTRDGKLTLNGQPIAKWSYLAELRARLAPRAPRDRVVFVGADEDARYGLLVKAIDQAKQAGATVIGMATDEPEKAR